MILEFKVSLKCTCKGVRFPGCLTSGIPWLLRVCCLSNVGAQICVTSCVCFRFVATRGTRIPSQYFILTLS